MMMKRNPAKNQGMMTWRWRILKMLLFQPTENADTTL